jgi:hypothetical protein
MSLVKLGSHLRILKTAAIAEDVFLEAPAATKTPVSKVIEAKNSDFLYYRARAISAGDQGPLSKDGSRSWNFNGNKDYFPRKELESSYETFVGRNIFLDHNSESSLYSIGKIIDALPIDDKQTGEFYIELVGKIDRTLHPEICRKIETGELNSTSMGCSVDESMCSICGKVLHSDADDKCDHMGMNLGKEFPAEVDLPEYSIKKGDMIPCFSINKGIVFNEDSIVGVPADPTAVIKTVLSNMKSQVSKKGSLSKKEQLDLSAQMDKLFNKLDDTTKIQLKADFCGICPPVEKESSMADKSVVPNDETKKILNKISAYEMEQLESYVVGKTKKANDIASLEVVADSAAKEESFLSKIVAKVKESLSKEAAKCERCEDILSEKDPSREYDPDCSGHLCAKHEEEHNKKASVTAKFTEDKNNVLDSTWSVNDGDKCVLEASLKEIWGSQFEIMSFSDQLWATSAEYANEIVARYTKEGIEKLADAWDVSNKLSKTAADPKMGPSGTRAKPSTGTSNKEHSYPTNPKFEKPKPGTSSKGPAAPAHKDVKDSKIEMPGQEKGQTGPAAPKAKVVKTDYAEPKVDAEGKEVKTTPKNPEEKKTEKSQKEVKTDYVAEGKERMEEEEKEGDKKSDKKSALISWASLTVPAQSFIKTAAKKYIESGMKNAEAVAKAHSEFIAQETDMKKQASDGTPDESVEGSTLPDGTKTMGDKVEESVQGTTVPGGAKPSAAPETSAQGDTEHKTPNLTKKPDEAVKGTTTPADHIPNTQKSDESSKGTTFPDSKKEVGDKAESAVKEAAKSESSAPIEAVQDKPALSKATAGDTPESSREGGDLKKDPKDIESVNKKAATEMPMPEDKGPMESMKPEMPVDEKPMDLPMGGPKTDAPGAEVSAFDTAENVDIGEGYTASKDKESKEIIVMKDGQEVKRLPDGFGKDMTVVLPLMKAVLGLPPEAEAKPEVPGIAAPVEEKMEEPKMDEHPGAEEAHEDELGLKESALKIKEAALAEKEATINAKEAAIVASEKAKKFASVIQVRAERCKKIVAALVEKDALQMSKEVYESEMKIGTYLLDAQKKAFEFAITAKQKELMAMDDNALLATEKVVSDLKSPATSVNTKRANRIFVSPSFGEELSEDAQLKKIFDTFGTKNRPQ